MAIDMQLVATIDGEGVVEPVALFGLVLGGVGVVELHQSAVTISIQGDCHVDFPFW